ncbi:MAG: DUF2058 domain-containing protein [Granulosicoccus sp.]
MSDSLRDQLLQAGFKQTAKEPAKGKQRHNRKPKKSGISASDQRNKKQAMAQEAVDKATEERKATKAKIKTLIESTESKEFAGDVVYRFTLQNRIRELHVKEDIRKQLVDGSLTITRLNGSTRLVPNTVADQIREINPQWAVVTTQSDSSDDNEGYEDFAVPDDIVW